MFSEMTSTTLENVQKILGKKFIDIILGVVVMCTLTSVCYYLGFFSALGIYMSDINISITELFDIQIVTLLGIIYAVAYGRELLSTEQKFSTTFHDHPLTTKYKINSTIIVSAIFVLMIFSIYQGPYDSDLVFKYLINNLGIFFFPSVITGFLMWCILSFGRSSVIEFAIIFCSISIVSYTTGLYKAEDLILNGAKNNHSIELANGKKMDVFLIKRFNSGDLVFYKNQPTFISKENDRIVKFRKLAPITAASTGTKMDN
jgi:hypothetical protein